MKNQHGLRGTRSQRTPRLAGSGRRTPPRPASSEWRVRSRRASTGTAVAPAADATSTGPSDALRDRLVAALLRHVDLIDLAELERANGSMDAVAERMLASIPGADVLDARVGPFYDTAGLRKWFRMSRQTLDAQARVGDVLCVMSADGFRLYPSFQFDARGILLPRLREVLTGLDPERLDLWGDAVWLNAPADELDGRTPAEALRTDRADEAVRLAAVAGSFRLG
ncbi:hypothetical protein [Curtobacterium sp. PhB115]|uniref:hypothetical protein n=1 Tax=Curtobacterium sp. PhB115 TaxID=2485173 RepID=UPI000F4CA71D|nr:hypothetical protein [Curtobacterium sp. PhB115]